jgi:ketosteroid isomerase-like protein
LTVRVDELKGREAPSQIQLAHIWTVRDGKAVKFQQYVDTYAIAESFK